MAALSQQETCVLYVHLNFKSDKDVDNFAEIFKPMTHYVKEKESGHTYAYKLLRSESDPLHLTIYERYESRAYWKDVHEQSQAYKDFKQRVQDSKLEPKMDIQVFYETDIGHMCG